MHFIEVINNPAFVFAMLIMCWLQSGQLPANTFLIATKIISPIFDSFSNKALFI